MEKAGMLLFAAAACAWDLRQGRIPNGLIVSGLVAGLCRQLAEQGLEGILLFLGGAALPVLLLWMLFVLGMLGAGDIKLLGVMGGFLGLRGSAVCVLGSILAGGVLAAFLMAYRGNLGSRLSCFAAYCRAYARDRKRRPYPRGEQEGGTFYFSIPILISVLFHVGGVY